MLLHTTSETGQPAVYINGGSIAARSIYSAQIQANAIIAEHLRAGQISSDHISTAGITADNIKGKTLSSSVPVSSGGSFINLDTGNINFAGGNLTWDNTTKTFYINASTLQIGGKNVLNTDTDLAAQINNKSTTRIQGNKLHFTNKVLMDDAFIELLTANNIFAQKIDAREIDANRITTGTLKADFIQGGTFDGQSMIVKNITADAIKGGTFDGQSMTIKNLTADAIVAGTLDMSKFTVSNLSADAIQTGNLDISSGLRVTSGNHQVMSIDPETLALEFNVSKMSIGGVKLISEEDRPQMEENIANELEGKLKQHLHIAYADDASGNGFSFSPLNKSYLGMYSDYNKEPLEAKEKYKWTKIKGEVGNPGQDAITIVLSNEAHTFVAGVTNAEAASDIIKVDAYKGTTKTPVKIGTITGTIADKITATITNNNTTNAQITINVTTALTTSSGNITIPITVDGKSFSKVYSWALSFKGNTGSAGGKGETGAPGANAKLVTLTGTGQIFTKPKVGSITPSKITVTASGQNTTILTSHWQYSINGGAFTTTKPAYVTVINSTTVDVANTMSNKTLAIKVRTADAVEDTLTIARIEDGLDGSDGTDATIAFLSNESHTFAGDINNAIAATDSIEVTAYKGSTKQNVSIGTITGQVTGLTAAIASNTNNTTAPKITITVTTALKEISGTLTIPLTVNGTIYTRYYSWSVARKGATGGPGSPGSPGSDAQILTLTPNNQVFKVPKTGAITPATITITATGQNISVPTANANWQYSVNGGTLTTTLPTGVTRSGAVVTVNGTTFTGNTLTTKVSSGAIQDTVTIYKAIDGVDGSKGDTGDRGPQGATGPQGVSITKVDVEYYLSTSSTSLAGGVWSTTAPAWKDGRFMWSKTVTTYTSGSPTESKPVCITGAKGSTGGAGATGRGVSSIVEQFYLSDSKTTQTGGSWVSTPPTWSPGKYIWTRSYITYTTGTPATDTTKPLVSSEWEAVNEIEIGGENLFAITNTAAGYESKGTINPSTEVHRTMNNLVDIDNTKSLIYQIWNPNKIINTSNSNRVAFFTEAGVHISSLAMPAINGSTYQIFKIQVPTNAKKARLGAIMGTGTIDPLIKIKFEKGNKATDWSPSPEDIEASYTAVAQAKADAERIKAQSYADGKLSAEEKKRIADAENKYKKALILSRASSGKLMNSDPNFSKNLNEFTVYNNASNGNVSIQYENASSSSGPSGVTRRLRITTTGAASPYWGGVVPSPIFMSRANAEYVIRFTALLPKGRKFHYAQNAMGTGYTGEWLTSAEGTGSWEEYIYSYKCGSTGSFSSFGHLYVLGGTTPTTASPLIWYLDKYEGLDISNVTGNPSQEDVDEKASAEDLTKVSNDLNTSIGDLSNTVDGKVDKSTYEEFLEHNADIQQQLSESTISAQENIDKALARTSIVEQKLGEGAADWIFTHTKIRMSDEGITLGEEGSGSYLQISNEQISFFNGSKEPVAFINGGMLHINHAIFVESIQISEFMFSSEISGHLTLRYVGN